jgi:hypothetical protein
MPKVEFVNGTRLDLYGDVHVSVDLNGRTIVNMRMCRPVRVDPRGSYNSLAGTRIAAIYAGDEQPGLVMYRNPDMPVGKEDIVTMVQVNPVGKFRNLMPVNPD